MTISPKIEQLRAKRAESQQGGGQARIQRQHDKGKKDRARTAGYPARSWHIPRN